MAFVADMSNIDIHRYLAYKCVNAFICLMDISVMKSSQKEQIKTQKTVWRDIESSLSFPVTSDEFLKSVRNILARHDAESAVEDEVWDKIKTLELELRWNRAARITRKIYAPRRPLHPAEIAMAIFKDGYICFGTALYWNEITGQVPSHYYVTRERKTKSGMTHLMEIDDYYLQDQFMKPAVESSNFATHEGYKFILVDRNPTGNLGVISRNISLTEQRISIRYTNLERTLLDCAIFPDRAGGIKNVVECFLESRNRLSIDKMDNYYKKLNLTYPYWQRIGLILEKTNTVKKTRKWRESFGVPQHGFYIDRMFKSNWNFDESWKVSYPPGLFQ